MSKNVQFIKVNSEQINALHSTGNQIFTGPIAQGTQV